VSKEKQFRNRAVPAKIGTIPMLVVFDGRCFIALNKKVRWKECVGGKWQTGIVDNVDPIRIVRF